MMEIGWNLLPSCVIGVIRHFGMFSATAFHDELLETYGVGVRVGAGMIDSRLFTAI